MTEYLRPKVLVSICLEHAPNRFDGSMISSPFVKKLKEYVDFITVCPEVAIGLPIPREVIRIVKEGESEELVHSMSGVSVSDKMRDFSQKYVDYIAGVGVHGAILKSRSPSCGIKDVKMYKSIGKAPSLNTKTKGFFGGKLIETFPDMAIEDEGRLTNYNIREHFLTRIYTMAAYDEVIKSGTMKALIDFHSHNKYLLMGYNQQKQKILGKIVANHEHLSVMLVLEAYEDTLRKALASPLRHGRNTNMLLHIFGYFKDRLDSDEKAYFLDVLEQYNGKKVPFSVPLSLLKSWVIRFREPYLSTQTIFEPFPREILDVTDSGKGVD